MENKEKDGVGVAIYGASLSLANFGMALEESLRRMEEPTRQKLLAILNSPNKTKNK
jgi:hypothetical protein